MEDEEFEPYNTQIYIYQNLNSHDLEKKTLICLNNKDFNGYPLTDRNINIITSNKKVPEIFAIGDSDGMIILFNAENLQIIKIFQEKCGHIGVPSLSNPITELVFMKNEMELLVGTSMGAISLYSSSIDQF